jgi:hypothetical protein
MTVEAQELLSASFMVKKQITLLTPRLRLIRIKHSALININASKAGLDRSRQQKNKDR